MRLIGLTSPSWTPELYKIENTLGRTENIHSYKNLNIKKLMEDAIKEIQIL